MRHRITSFRYVETQTAFAASPDFVVAFIRLRNGKWDIPQLRSRLVKIFFRIIISRPEHSALRRDAVPLRFMSLVFAALQHPRRFGPDWSDQAVFGH